MSFVPQASVLDTPLDGKSVKIKDDTGTVGVSSNTTGYGQDTPPHNAPVVYGFVGKLLTSVSWLYNFFIKAADAPNIQTTGHSVLATLADLTKFADGVNVFNMLAYQSLGAFSLSSDKKTVTLTTNTAVQSYMTAGYEWAAAILTATDTGHKNIEIDVDATIALNASNQIILKEAMDVVPLTYTFNIAKPAIFRFLELAAGHECLVKSIGNLTDFQKDPKESANKLCTFVQMQLAGKINFSCKDYAQAHDTIITLGLKCGAGCSGC